MIKSVFFTNQRVLGVYSLSWLIERFFLETVGVEYASLSAAAEHTMALPLLNIERKLSRVRNNTPFSLALNTIALPDVAQTHSIGVV